MGFTPALWPSENVVLSHELMDLMVKTLVIPSVSVVESSHPVFDILRAAPRQRVRLPLVEGLS